MFILFSTFSVVCNWIPGPSSQDFLGHQMSSVRAGAARSEWDPRLRSLRPTDPPFSFEVSVSTIAVRSSELLVEVNRATRAYPIFGTTSSNDCPGVLLMPQEHCQVFVTAAARVLGEDCRRCHNRLQRDSSKLALLSTRTPIANRHHDLQLPSEIVIPLPGDSSKRDCNTACLVLLL